MRHSQVNNHSGFTLIEILVISPIVILFIGAFVGLIVGLTGESLRLREKNVSAYDVQNALDDIELNAARSTAFLSTTGTLPSSQGKNDTTAAFTATTSGAPDSLIFTAVATDKGPYDTTRSVIYKGSTPCATTNPLYTYSTIYFVGSDSNLYRRQIMSTDPACTAPYQKSTCSEAVMAASPPSYCQTSDDKLASNVSGFTVIYYTATGAVTTDPTAASTIKVSITSTRSIAGQSLTYSGDVRLVVANAGTTAAGQATTNYTPSASGYIDSAAIDNFICQWQPIGAASGYNVSYSIGGTNYAGPQNTQATNYTIDISAARGKNITCQVTAVIAAGNYNYPVVSLSPVPLWTAAPYQNNWVDYGGFAGGGFTKTASGMIALHGLVKGGSPNTIFTLPPGYRPANILLFIVVAYNGGNSFGRVDVNPDGTVVMSLATNGWVSLDGINFMPSSYAGSFTPATFSGGWVNYSAPGGHQQAGYMQDSTGRTRTQGLVKSGTVTDGTLIFGLPSNLRPSAYEHVAALNNSSPLVIGLDTGTGVLAKGGSNAWLEVNSLTYPASYGGWNALPLANSWTAYSASFSSPRYTKSTDGLVMLKGLIKRSAAPAASTAIATMPGNQGLCPKEQIIVYGVSYLSWMRIDVTAGTATGGCSVIFSASGNANNYLWSSLDNVSWIGEV
jgi:type II secretory pathway pseudopilin PulG